MPGGGKSTVGRQLARRLGWPFVDSDGVIEQRIGEPIRSYFERQGEERFRDIEAAVIGEICAQGAPQVVATGGGACLRESNRRALHERCTVVYLRSTPEELFRRLRHDTQRPLLQVADPLQKLRDLFKERDPLYRRAAHFIIEAARPSVPALMDMVLMQLELAGLAGGQAPADPSNPSNAVRRP